MFRQCKQRRVDILTKSSLRPPRDRTRVYIQRDFASHERDTETYGIEEKGNEENRTIAKWIAKRVQDGITQNGMEEKAREHTRRQYRPTGGWAMRVNVSIVQMPSG